MKDKYTTKDCKRLHDAIVQGVMRRCDNESATVVLLSGGVDSLTSAYALMDAGIPFSAVTLSFNGVESKDAESVRRLQKSAGLSVKYVDVKINRQNVDDIKKAVSTCRLVFGKVRKVKVETIYGLQAAKREIGLGSNVVSGFCGDDALGYSRQDAIKASRDGDESLVARRMGKETPDEFTRVFDGCACYTPFRDDSVTSIITEFTISACNARYPKSILVEAFKERHMMYKSFRKPINFQKGGSEDTQFELLAESLGYSSALQMFNRIGEE